MVLRPAEPSNMSNAQEEAVRSAMHNKDLTKLQEISLLPGGFGRTRKQAWPFLLGVTSSIRQDTSIPESNDFPHIESRILTESPRPNTPGLSSTSPYDLTASLSDSFCGDIGDIPHPDEHQVRLDTDRSFVLYPIVNPSLANRKRLQQELHDIILGVLRKRPALRYFQGYHDILTVLYLTLPSELVLSSAEKLSIHRLRDSMGKGLDPLIGQLRILKRLLRMVDPAYARILEQNSPLPYYALSNLLTLFAHDIPTLPLIQHVFDWLLCREPVASIWLAAAVLLSKKEDVLALEREGDEAMGMMHAVLSTLPPLYEDEPTSGRSSRTSTGQAHTYSEKDEIVRPPSYSDPMEKTGDENPVKSSNLQPHATTPEAPKLDNDSLTDSWTADAFHETSPPPLISELVTVGEFEDEEIAQVIPDLPEEIDADQSEIESEKSHSHSQARFHSRSPSQLIPGDYKEKKHSPPLPLTELLRHASNLLSAYPPSSPSLRLKETFGSQSAMRLRDSHGLTIFSYMEDDEAEACVGGDEVVLPLNPMEEDEEITPIRKLRRSGYMFHMWNLSKAWSAKCRVGRRQTIIAGFVLFLGVVIALYGVRPEGKGADLNGSGKLLGYGNLGLMAWIGRVLGSRQAAWYRFIMS